MDKFRALTFFCRTAETKSFSAAARLVGVPLSVLSKTIAALEADLQFALFHRSTRHLSLTEPGASYYARCRELLAELQEAEGIARDQGKHVTGVLHVGIHPVFRDALYGRISEFLIAHPNLSVEISHTNSPSALVQEGVDVILRVGDMPDSSFVARRLGTLRLVTCASPKYLDQHGRPKHPKDLSRHHAIIPGRRDEESFVRWTFQKNQKRETISVPISLVLREGIGLGLTAIGGFGVARFYDFAAQPFVDAGTLEPILTEWTDDPQPIYAVTPTRKDTPAKVRAFLQFAETLLAPKSATNARRRP